MAQLRYITHPNVEIDPSLPVNRWGLSDEGTRRALAMLAQPWAASVKQIVASDETKAIETAATLADHCGLTVEVRRGIGENDRSSTGFVPPVEFELLADTFFANPDQSIRGWERACDAQARVVRGLGDLLEAKADVAVVGHDGVGTLWYCHLTGQTINRSHDQPGQGHYFTVDLNAKGVLHPWQPIDRI